MCTSATLTAKLGAMGGQNLQRPARHDDTAMPLLGVSPRRSESCHEPSRGRATEVGVEKFGYDMRLLLQGPPMRQEAHRLTRSGKERPCSHDRVAA
jgi:hypothetical protein